LANFELSEFTAVLDEFVFLLFFFAELVFEATSLGVVFTDSFGAIFETIDPRCIGKRGAVIHKLFSMHN
jgi:hypothetical protein